MWNPELTAMTSDSERIVRNQANKSFPTTFRQAEHRNEAVQGPGESLDAALESDTEGPPFKVIIGQDLAPEVNPSISDQSIAPKLRIAMRKMAEEKAKSIFAEQVDPSMQKATEEALPHNFFVGF